MTYGRRTAAAGAVLAAAVLLAGCSSGGRASSHGAAAVAQAPQAAAGQPATARPSAGASAGQAGAVQAEARQISYTAQLTVRVEDVAKAVQQAEALVGPGGYVGEEQVQSGEDGGQAGARLVLKLPTAGFPQALDRLAALGRVLDRRSQAQDLTQQLVDLDSRVKSQQASVERVRELMKNATALTDVVSLEAELSRREADLESLQRQQQDLGGQVALSTVTLQLTAAPAVPAAPVKPREKGFWSAVGSAFAGGGRVLLTVLRGIVIVVAAAAPFLLVAAGFGALLWALRRSRAQRRPLSAAQYRLQAEQAEQDGEAERSDDAQE